ncbi:MAG TPA: hypothetical protein VEP90_13605, partial [Methylomirabilota bacterium]|nr:hypothetical protein [Methylomirabilota bacterium]
LQYGAKEPPFLRKIYRRKHTNTPVESIDSSFQHYKGLISVNEIPASLRVPPRIVRKVLIRKWLLQATSQNMFVYDVGKEVGEHNIYQKRYSKIPRFLQDTPYS